MDFSINYEKDTWVHRLDPRAKLIYIVVFVTMPLIFTSFTALLVCAALVLPVWISAKIDIRPLKGLIIGILIYSFINVLFSTFYNYSYPGEYLTIKIGPLVATSIGFRSGLILGFRSAIPAFVALILISTTDPAGIAKAMMKMKLPLSVAFMMMGALRMFPLVFDEMENIKTAQIIRGVKYGGIKNNFNAFKLAVFPLMVNSLRKSRVTGLAVESKGFGKRAWKEYYQEFNLTTMDYMIIIGSIAALIIALILRFYFKVGIDYIIV